MADSVVTETNDQNEHRSSNRKYRELTKHSSVLLFTRVSDILQASAAEVVDADATTAAVDSVLL